MTAPAEQTMAERWQALADLAAAMSADPLCEEIEIQRIPLADGAFIFAGPNGKRFAVQATEGGWSVVPRERTQPNPYRTIQALKIDLVVMCMLQDPPSKAWMRRH